LRRSGDGSIFAEERANRCSDRGQFVTQRLDALDQSWRHLGRGGVLKQPRFVASRCAPTVSEAPVRACAA
jgi:hypothetical protein